MIPSLSHKGKNIVQTKKNFQGLALNTGKPLLIKNLPSGEIKSHITIKNHHPVPLKNQSLISVWEF